MIKTTISLGVLLAVGLSALPSPRISSNQVPAGQGSAAKQKPAASRSTKEFQIDGMHSTIVFRVRHLGVSNFWGRFNKVSGRFLVDDARLAESFAELSIAAASVDTHSPGRDKHIKSPDFLSAKEFPKITFKSAKVVKKGDVYAIHGKLTLRGIERAMTIEARHIGTRNAGRRFGLRSGYEARFTIRRSDFGMKYGLQQGVLGDEILIICGLEGMIGR